MKSEWKVTSNIIMNQKYYAVYRLIDKDRTDHSGNREMATGCMTDKMEAVAIAERLNRDDEG